MAMIKIGDKVRFLNSVGGGIVKGFQDKKTALVEDESGFDIPVLIHECVVIEEGEKKAGLNRAATPSEKVTVEPKKTIPEPPKAPRTEESSEGERLSVYLAYLPIDAKTLTQSGYEAYLINGSNYYLYYNYMSATNRSWVSRSQGLIEPNTRIFMEEFEKENLNELEHICVQMIAFKQGKPYSLKNAQSVELRLDTVKFYKLHCFTANPFFEDDALVVPVIEHDVPVHELLVSTTELQEAMMQKKREDRRASQPVAVSSKPSGVIEIDLHIDQLLDSTAGMSASDMLHYQMDKFHAVLKEHASEKGCQIVFIHGKGEGVLRAAIEKELKTRYKSYQFQDASFREYGYGATLVKIR